VPFSHVAQPAIAALGAAAQRGRAAVRVARPTVAKLRTVAETAHEPATDLRFVLEHLDDRNAAVEPNEGAPVPSKGFTGLEAFLQYFFKQTEAINIFDQRGHLLKIALIASDCGKYTNAQTARSDPARYKRCNAALGPSRPGIDNDIGAVPGQAASAGPSPSARAKRQAKLDPAAAAGAAGAAGGGTPQQPLLDYLLGG
jgi:hypothetical protein